jgi:Ca2+-transporting ATPase
MSFGIDPSELHGLVDFDRRDEPGQVTALASRGGAEGLCRALGSDPKRGIATSGGSVRQRQDTFGENYIPPPPQKSLFKLVIEQFEDRTLQILLVGGTVSLILGAVFDREEQGWIEGLAIYLAIIIVVSVTAINDYAKEKKFRKAQDQQKDREVKVTRDGTLCKLSTYEIVVGDLVELSIGDEVPADGVYVRGLRLAVDEAALTGESKVVKKSDERPFLFAGATVGEGDGTMLVTTVGRQSAGGRIQELLNQAEVKPTPLQDQLDDLAVKIGWFGIAMGILTFLALTIRWAVDVSNEAWDNERLIDLVHYFVIGVTIVVVAVPEGLPLAVTIALAFSMLKMIKDRNFVRHLDASETMGEATCICSDKTGTLTQNRMTVTSTCILRRELLDRKAPPLGEEVLHHLSVGMCVNSKAYLTPATEPGGLDVVVGNKTEGALINLAKGLGVDYTRVRAEMKLVEQFPFTSDRKRMSTIVESTWRDPQGQGKYVQYVKGASEIVLELCRFECHPDGGRPLPISRDAMRQYEAAIDGFARSGLRTLTVAYRWLDDVPKPGDKDAEADLVLIGVLGIKDPVREQVPAAVRRCQSAGITVRMVTGDNILTANHIAAECGILTDNAVSIEGPQFRAMSDEQRLKIIPRLRVLARSSPEDKQVLVKALMGMGEVVAVTGDGTNDAPALKEADVGFAMGIAGTDIAKNASDIILLDDNFASIVNAIKWGRNVFDAIRKFLQFQLAVNVVALVVVFVGSVADGESPMSTVQLLWVNLIMDTLGALALATGDPDPGIARWSGTSRSSLWRRRRSCSSCSFRATRPSTSRATRSGASARSCFAPLCSCSSSTCFRRGSCTTRSISCTASSRTGCFWCSF